MHRHVAKRFQNRAISGHSTCVQVHTLTSDFFFLFSEICLKILTARASSLSCGKYLQQETEVCWSRDICNGEVQQVYFQQLKPLQPWILSIMTLRSNVLPKKQVWKNIPVWENMVLEDLNFLNFLSEALSACSTGFINLFQQWVPISHVHISVLKSKAHCIFLIVTELVKSHPM